MITIAIDGPSGSGKSTLAKEVAKRLNITYVDTGAMYRALAYKVKNLNLQTEDEIKCILSLTDINYKDGIIYLDGVDVSEFIRSEEISKAASDISKIEFVREYLVNKQREISEKIPVVMEGRDIGTVVLKNAKFKFFLTATLDARANRRYKQLLEKGEKVDFSEVKKDLEKRDYQDSNREHSPLKKADDAILIDNSNLSFEENVNLILEAVK